jgi:hypothetical protein
LRGPNARLACGVLFVVVAAPGAGKTAVVPALRESLPGVVVLDLDEFLDPAGELAGVDLRYAADKWPAYGRTCLRLVAAVVAAGVDCVLLGPLEPRQVDATGLGEVAWAVLDCPDGTRRERLRARAMDDAGIRHALGDAHQLRALGVPVLGSHGTVAETAARIRDWVTQARR